MNVGMHAALHMRPRVAAVQAAVHSVHLDPGPDGAAVLRVNHQHGHHRRANVTLLGHLYRQLGPALPAVLGAEKGCGLDSHEDVVGVLRVNGD